MGKRTAVTSSPSSSAVSNKPVKKAVARDLARVGDDGRPQADDCRRVVCRRIVVGDGPPDGAPVAHLRVADAVRQMCEGRDRSANVGGAGNVSMGRQRTDDDGVALDLDRPQGVDPGDVDEVGGLRQPLLHGRQDRVAAGRDSVRLPRS